MNTMIETTPKAIFARPNLPPEKLLSAQERILQGGGPFETRTTPTGVPPDTPILDIIHECFRAVGESELLLESALDSSDINSDFDLRELVVYSVFPPGDNRAVANVEENILYRYWDFRSIYWNDFRLSFLELTSALNRAMESSWSIGHFVDRMSKPRSRVDAELLVLFERFYSSGWKISFLLTRAYHLIEHVWYTDPDIESYSFYPFIIEILDFFNNASSIYARGHHLNCIIRDIHDAQIEAQDIARNLHERFDKQSSELWRLKFAQAPDYPPPNTNNEWTVKVIADYYGVQERAVTRMIKERFANLSHGFGKRITLNQHQMEVVAHCLMKKPTIGKKIAEVKRRNT